MKDAIKEDFFEVLSVKEAICGKKLFDKWQTEAYNNIIEGIRYLLYIAGWSSLVARRAHNPKVVGSNPSPATYRFQLKAVFFCDMIHQ